MLRSYCAGEHKLYFEWLLNLVGGESWWAGLEENMARLLERKYYWNNKIDQGIVQGSLELRTKCMREKAIPIYMIPSDEPSVLEVLIYTAYMVDGWLMYNPDYESRWTQFFAEIISVLGFDAVDADQIDERIDEFLDGKIRLMEGEFGADPSNPTLWEQVNAYYSPLFDLENADE